MLPPKALLDTLSTHASRLFSGDSPLPRAELEAQFKALARALRAAVQPDPRVVGIPSAKGAL